METDKVLKNLGSGEKGLSESEARKRLHKFGLNQFEEKKKISPWTIFFNQFKSLLIIILIIASVISFLIESVVDAAVILIIVILNAVLGFRQEYKAEKAMDALKKLAAPMTLVIRDGKKKEIESRYLVPGDVVVLEEGAKVPADMRLIEIASLRVDEASLTGESTPVSKELNVFKRDVEIAERKNMAFMGTVVTTGRAMGVVTGTGMKTEMGKIAEMIQVQEEKTTPLQHKLAVFSKNLGVLILVICAIITIVGILKGEEVLSMFITGVALAVAAIPEGLPAVVTITLAFGLQRMAKNNAIVRKLSAVETLGCTTVICSDKTGTLTRNEMVVENIYYDGKTIQVTGEGYKPQGDFLLNKKKINPLKDKGLSLLLKIGGLCNNAELQKSSGEWNIIGDPTEGALVVAAHKAGLAAELGRYRRKKEIPFSSERKMMTTVNLTPGGKQCVYTKGATETMLNLCTKIYRNGKISRITPRDKKDILNANHMMTEKALRVLAMGFKKVQGKDISEKKLESDLVFMGLAGMMDLPREEVKKDIAICKNAGIGVIMITGDHRNTAVAIARDIGILEAGKKGRVLTGAELDSMGDKEFSKIAENVCVYARVNPIHKVRILEALKNKGHVVAMTGDGVNDAPALKKSDIGVSMGIKGTDVAKEASDMVLKDDNFSSIVTAVKSGREIYDNILKFIQYLLSSNLGEVLVVFLAMLIGFADPATGAFLLPVTAVQLLWINLLTDGLPAVALGLDPPASDIMNRKPRDSKERILSREMLTDIIIVGIVICIGTLLIFNINLPEGGIKAQTAAFTMLVVFEMVRVQSVRMKYRVGIFSNKKLILAIIVSIILQLAVIYIPLLQTAFGTTPLTPVDWVEIILVSSTVLIIMWFKRVLFRK